VFSAVSISQVISFTPNVSKARAASISLFEIIDRQSRIDAFKEGGKNMETNGKVTANKVHFNYPARPDVPVLKGFQAEVPAGKTVAIVGSSGSGKSTLVSLVQRFYDTKEGKVTVEDTDVRSWNLPGLRSQMAMVGQEPVLFDMSIGENIAYGVENASQEMIEQAAQSANIHEFIKSLPEGYNTSVGEKGAQLSGGQKQRVAIARAIIRNPRLLLLDEATSALDSESEKIVQNALDRAAQNRTTITIAHRLSTIQDADVILVVKNGAVIEQGKHQELIRRKGFYYSLVQRQSLTS
jgi:ABC-type multidrug transport system fused ATPase/permease subunit